MAREQYVSQVQLLVRSLPYIGEEKAFALKGGTAINLFYRDLPRLSVDIDLTYLPVKQREESLKDIDETLDRIGGNISQHLRGAKVRRIAGGGGKLVAGVLEGVVVLLRGQALFGDLAQALEEDRVFGFFGDRRELHGPFFSDF